MVFFSFVAFIWLTKELRLKRPPAIIMENFGIASYSLYLIHPIVIGVVENLNLELPAPWYSLLMTAATALATAMFYYCVEAPSHHLARLLSRRFQPVKPRTHQAGTLEPLRDYQRAIVVWLNPLIFGSDQRTCASVAQLQ